MTSVPYSNLRCQTPRSKGPAPPSANRMSYGSAIGSHRSRSRPAPKISGAARRSAHFALGAEPLATGRSPRRHHETSAPVRARLRRPRSSSSTSAARAGSGRPRLGTAERCSRTSVAPAPASVLELARALVAQKIVAGDDVVHAKALRTGEALAHVALAAGRGCGRRARRDGTRAGSGSRPVGDDWQRQGSIGGRRKTATPLGWGGLTAVP